MESVLGSFGVHQGLLGVAASVCVHCCFTRMVVLRTRADYKACIFRKVNLLMLVKRKSKRLREKRGTGSDCSSWGEEAGPTDAAPCMSFQVIVHTPWGQGLLIDTQVCLTPVSSSLLCSTFWLGVRFQHRLCCPGVLCPQPSLPRGS